MEPLNDNELNQLLRQWEAPAAPPALRQRVFHSQGSLWRFLLMGSVRVPVPVAVLAACLVALWLHYSATDRPQVQQPARVSLADFEPVRQLEPILVSGGQK